MQLEMSGLSYPYNMVKTLFLEQIHKRLKLRMNLALILFQK